MKIFKLKELKVHMFICYERLDEFQARRKNSGGGGDWAFLKKFWPTCLGDQEDSSIEIA